MLKQREARVQARERAWRPNQVWYRIGLALWGFVFKVLFPMRVQGKEHVPADGPVILVCNHISGLDPFALGVACPRWPQFLAKEELFRVPVFSYLIRQWGAIAVDRFAADMGSARAALQVLRAGEVLAIFPEGTRSITGELQAFRYGPVKLALMRRVPIVPTAITGTDQVLPKGAMLPRRHAVRLVFGPPLRLWELLPDESEASRKEGTRLLYEAVRGLMAVASG